VLWLCRILCCEDWGKISWRDGRGYARLVDVATGKARLLLIDTCGETAGVAVCVGSRVVASEDMERGRASAEIVAAVRRLLAGVGWRLAELDAVGVVSGPGSFTGMRTGLAAAKGLCEAPGVELAAVSRLEVLADAAGVSHGFVALDAGRGEVYVREVATGREWLCEDAELAAQANAGDANWKGKSNDKDRRNDSDRSNDKDRSNDNDRSSGRRAVVVAEERLAERLGDCEVVIRELHVGDALGAVLRRLAEGADDAAGVDANYVRGEREIYRKEGQAAKAAAGS
jgi:tRNA threonylcarbamoyladenosine biosynthesis protein TsaB